VAAEPRRYQGRLVQRLVAPGSKSAHDAVLLECPEGSFPVRRSGAPAFDDPRLKALVGQRIDCLARLHQGVLLIESWQVIG
jgi:hypothetical protein